MTDQNYKTSFIPTKPIQPVGKGGGLGMSSGNFLNVVTLVIFLITVVTAGSVYVLGIFLEKEVQSQISELESVRKSLDSPLVTMADRLNTRIETVKTLLQDHLSPSEIFVLLEKNTLDTVKFDRLEYSIDPSGNIKISASGKAKDYESIVLQSKQYAETGNLRDVLFSGLQPDQQSTGKNFELEAVVSKPLVLYRSRYERENNVDTENTDEKSDSQNADSFEYPDNDKK